MSLHSLPDLNSTRQWIKSFTVELKRPCVVLLEGDLGSGKTQFVRWFLEELGVNSNDVASPTFAIHNEYSGRGGSIDHVDLYRVNSDADLEATGFWDLMTGNEGLVFVEWADRLPMNVWPNHWSKVRIHLRKNADKSEAREMELEIIEAKKL